MDNTENFSPAHMRSMASSLTESIYAYSPSTALKEVEDGMRQWYYCQPGVLFPYRIWDISAPTYYGGLAKNQALFVVVPAGFVHARRRYYLRYLAVCMGMKEQAQLEAYCEEAVREVIEDPSPRPHPAFEADALARQVAYWLGLLAYRQSPQTDDWRW